MLYNPKWFEVFQLDNQFALKNECKEALPILDISPNKCDLVKCNYWIFHRAKKEFLSIQKLISFNLYGGNFLYFFHIF